MEFVCDKCGLCCKGTLLRNADPTLDRGDGVCKYLTDDNLCSIYEERPWHCRSEDVYERVGKALGMSYEEHCRQQASVCENIKNGRFC